ncbi:hypothetical protein E2C01_090432 [Portunus trituberculatus]|uniref:Uncharacterized protein n=1 Tax=Portunus trituberculatus TaxID=210409 RepID=A0A5B7JEP1_PORTR|nr:hypothetical protein [Portunus trituberculatus]
MYFTSVLQEFLFPSSSFVVPVICNSIITEMEVFIYDFIWSAVEEPRRTLTHSLTLPLSPTSESHHRHHTPPHPTTSVTSITKLPRDSSLSKSRH